MFVGSERGQRSADPSVRDSGAVVWQLDLAANYGREDFAALEAMEIDPSYE